MTKRSREEQFMRNANAADPICAGCIALFHQLEHELADMRCERDELKKIVISVRELLPKP